jgi:hypothetical protein
VPRTEHLQVQFAQPAKRIQVQRHRAASRRYEDASLSEDRVAAEQDAPGEQRDVIGRMAGCGKHGERPGPVAVREDAVGAHPGRRLAHRLRLGGLRAGHDLGGSMLQ